MTKLRALGSGALPQLRALLEDAEPETRELLLTRIPAVTCPKWAVPGKDAKADESTLLPTSVVDKKTMIELVLVPAGEFMMGDSAGDKQESSDHASPAHKVRIAKPFYLGRFEVTTDQWTAVIGAKPELARPGSYPVVGVSWTAIQPFLQRTGFRLPMEAEWEFACRAGTKGARYGELDEIAWHGGNSESRGLSVMLVGGKRPNALGLYDMLGNAWEWCSDNHGKRKTDENEQKRGAAASEITRGLRGGGVSNLSRHWLRASGGSSQIESYTNMDLGFRVARNP